MRISNFEKCSSRDDRVLYKSMHVPTKYVACVHLWLSGSVSTLYTVVAGSISSGGDHGIHC